MERSTKNKVTQEQERGHNVYFVNMHFKKIKKT